MTVTAMPTVRLITVANDTSTTSADTDDGASRRSYMRLPEFLARTDLIIPTGTPIMRFDLAPHHVAVAFAIGGPMHDCALAPGMEDPMFGPLRKSRGTPHPLARVALDVYLRHARKAGIPVEVTPNGV